MVTVDCSLVGRRLPAFLVVCIIAVGVSACSDTTGVPTSSHTMGVRTSNVQVLLLTGAPSDMIASAGVWISHVYLQGRVGEPEEDGAGRVDLFNDPGSPHHYDLLELQDGLTADPRVSPVHCPAGSTKAFGWCLTGFVEIEAGGPQLLRRYGHRLVDGAKWEPKWHKGHAQ